MTTMTTDPRHDWKQWHEHRTATVSAPYGLLSLTGTYWLADHPEGRIPAVPGSWREDGDEVVLTAVAEDGLSVDGRPLTGEIRLGVDHTPVQDSRVAHGGRRLVVMRREGLFAVRDFDPGAPARQAFAGIEATPYDPRWTVPGTFHAYDEQRTVRVGNADGRERGLGLSGELVFELGGARHSLHAAVESDGSLWAVFADATSGNSSYRFRFLRPAAPAENSSVIVDFNRALLPPCAFAGHFICPLPPPATRSRWRSRPGNGTWSPADASHIPETAAGLTRPGRYDTGRGAPPCRPRRRPKGALARLVDAPNAPEQRLSGARRSPEPGHRRYQLTAPHGPVTPQPGPRFPSGGTRSEDQAHHPP